MLTNGEMRFLKKNLKEKAILFDVGANIGQWTRMALTFDKTLNIHCFEPSKYTYNELLKNNFPQNVICNNIGLSSEKKEEFLYTFKNGAVGGTMYRRKGLDYHYGRTSQEQKEKIKLETLENYCLTNKIGHIDYLKIDVEGHELEVLKGGRKFFKNNQVSIIQFEYGGTYIDSHIFLKDIFDLFKNFNYDFYKIYPNNIRSSKQYQSKYDNFQYQNWLIINKDYKFNP